MYQNLEIYMNIRRELEKLKFIPLPKVFIDPTCNMQDQSKMKDIVAKLGGQIASVAGEHHAKRGS